MVIVVVNKGDIMGNDKDKGKGPDKGKEPGKK
jgi:hypothetical protein